MVFMWAAQVGLTWDISGIQVGCPSGLNMGYKWDLGGLPNGLNMGYRWVPCGLNMGYKWDPCGF